MQHELIKQEININQVQYYTQPIFATSQVMMLDLHI